MFKKKNYEKEDALENVLETVEPVKEKKKKKPVNKKKRNRIIALVIVVVIIALLVIRSKMAGNVLPIVETAEVQKGTVVQELSTNGTITAVNTKTYASPVNAKVEKVNFKLGDTVAAGDCLIDYDTASLEESYSLADLQAKSAVATNNDSVNKSNQGQTDKTNAESSISSLQSQIDAKNTEIANMQNDIKNNSIYQNDVNAAIATLTSQIQNLTPGTTATASTSSTTTTTASATLTPEQAAQLAQYQQDLENYKAQLTSVSNNLIAQQAALTTLQTQLSDLTTQKANAEADKQTAEAKILSDDQRASLSYNNEVSKLNVTTAGDELSKATAGINSDNTGIVTEIDITDGAVATEGMALITVADTSDMEIAIQVSKYDMERLEVGKEAQITALGNTYHGTVNNISRMATEGSSGAKMVNATIHIDDPDDKLVIGLDAKAVIGLGTAENVLTVPLTAVNTDNNGSFVYVVEDGTVVKRAVTTGLTSDSTIEIEDGLKEGEQVITLVDATIVEGMMVMTTTDIESTSEEKTVETEQATEAK